jgi:hypothetical protein
MGNELNKMTAVEWLWEQIDEILPFSVDTETGIKLYNAKEQAKKMEKKQHDKTSLDWHIEGLAIISNNRKWNNFEDYWIQTYGGNK